jgi:hypothetical protein
MHPRTSYQKPLEHFNHARTFSGAYHPVILKEAPRATFRRLRVWRRLKNPAPHLPANAGSHPAPNCQARAGWSVARCRTAARRKIRSGILRSRRDRLGGQAGSRSLRMTWGGERWRGRGRVSQHLFRMTWGGNPGEVGAGFSTPAQDVAWCGRPVPRQSRRSRKRRGGQVSVRRIGAVEAPIVGASAATSRGVPLSGRRIHSLNGIAAAR